MKGGTRFKRDKKKKMHSEIQRGNHDRHCPEGIQYIEKEKNKKVLLLITKKAFTIILL